MGARGRAAGGQGEAAAPRWGLCSSEVLWGQARGFAGHSELRRSRARARPTSSPSEGPRGRPAGRVAAAGSSVRRGRGPDWRGEERGGEREREGKGQRQRERSAGALPFPPCVRTLPPAAAAAAPALVASGDARPRGRTRETLSGPGTGSENRLRLWGRAAPKTVMILPQVHLRKPCYDFYFL